MCRQPPDGGCSALYSKHTNGLLGAEGPPERAGVLMLSAGLEHGGCDASDQTLPCFHNGRLCAPELGRAQDPKTGEQAPTLWHWKYVGYRLPWGDKPRTWTHQGRPPKDPRPTKRHPVALARCGGCPGGRQVGPRLTNCPHGGSIQERGHIPAHTHPSTPLFPFGGNSR